MSEYAALHTVSLLLVGSNIKRIPPMSVIPLDMGEEVVELMPEDEMLMDYNKTHNYSKSSNSSSAQQKESETTGIEMIMQPRHEKDVLVLVDDVVGDPNESRWRAHGLARRRKLLEEDKRSGGREFSLSFDCSVQRYFSVAHWALEQFHQLYQSNSSSDDVSLLEETYVMGHRIVAFLTECLPQHPGLSRDPFVQERSKMELDLLRECLKDVALRIDEHVCNQFVDDGDLFLDSMIAAEMEKEDDDDETKTTATTSEQSPAKQIAKSDEKSVRFERWANFPEEAEKSSGSAPQKERKLSLSPTEDTIVTTGTESDIKSNPSDLSNSEHEEIVRQMSESESSSSSSSSETIDEEEPEHDYFRGEDRVIRDDDGDFDFDELSLSSYSSHSLTVTNGRGGLDFLRKIACEPVLYETDSEAADSWANGEDGTHDTNSRSRPCLPSSSGVTPTSDPARIAFRDLMNKLPHKSILQRDNTTNTNNRSRSVPSQPPSPTFSDIMEERDSAPPTVVDDDVLDEVLDEVVEHEMNLFLDDTSVRTEVATTQYFTASYGQPGTKGKRTNRRRSTRKVWKQRSSLSLDSSSSSSSVSSSSHDSLSAATSSSTPLPTPSTSEYTSLASLKKSSSLESLKKRTGSERSAFSSFDKTKQPQKQQRQEPVATDTFLKKDEWISFDNFVGSSFFATTASN